MSKKLCDLSDTEIFKCILKLTPPVSSGAKETDKNSPREFYFLLVFVDQCLMGREPKMGHIRTHLTERQLLHEYRN